MISPQTLGVLRFEGQVGDASMIVDGTKCLVDRAGATSHVYETAEIWLSTTHSYPGSGLLIEAPLRNGTYIFGAVASAEIAQMRYSKLGNGIDIFRAESWDSDVAQFVTADPSLKIGTGKISLAYNLISQDQYRVQTLINGVYHGILRHRNEDGRIIEMSVEGELKKIPLSIPLRHWRPAMLTGASVRQ